jgi:hypothetical protein
MNKPIQIFKPGKRTAMSGEVIEFTQTMLDATAAAYDPALHEAPFVKGHPKTDDPAYGWAASIVSKPGILLAVPRQVEPAFAEDVKAGRWKKRSASFYPPNHPGNPVPGVYYVKHIGFLGAVPPAIKGMEDPEFSEAEDGLLTFSEEIGAADFAEWDDVDNASLWRSLRDWIIGKFGKDEADSVIPPYTVQSLEQSARKELDESLREDQAAGAPAPAFADPQPKGDEMSAEEKARLAELEAENAANKARLAEFAEAEKKRAADARHADHLSFAEGLVKEGKLLPANKDLAVATLDYMAGQEQVIEFGEGDAKKPLIDAFKKFLQAQPKQVEFGEVAGAGGDADGTVNFAAPSGYGVDADRLALHNKALAHQAAHKTTYEAALAAVSA